VIRAVLDTNIIVSGLGWGGAPGQVLEAARTGRFITVMDFLPWERTVTQRMTTFAQAPA